MADERFLRDLPEFRDVCVHIWSQSMGHAIIAPAGFFRGSLLAKLARRARDLIHNERRGGPMPKMTDPKELLVHELKDLLYAERRFLTATKHLARETANPEIKQRIQQHVGETERQIDRLGKAFEAIGEKAKGEKCEGAIGLREEHDSFKSEEKPSKELLGAFDLGSGLRVEHYEIAGYRTAIAARRPSGRRSARESSRRAWPRKRKWRRFWSARHRPR
jgi:ferritin-like metal-binding protein YciE